MPQIVIPLKRLAIAKGRLAGALDPPARRALVLEMLGRVVAAARAAGDLLPAPPAIWLLSAEPALAALAAELGVRPLPDAQEELNAALTAARARLAAGGATALLVLAGDLPLAAPADVAALLAALAEVDVAIAPDAAGTGTNALAMRLPTALPLAYGAASAAAHLATAARLGLTARAVAAPSLALDVDDPAALARYRAAGVGLAAIGARAAP